MAQYLIKRVLVMVPTLAAISVISFAIIILPPGDYLTRYMLQMQEDGEVTGEEEQQLEVLRERYGLDQPVFVQYLIWIGKVLRGQFGFSFAFGRPVEEIIWERIGLTLAVSLSSLLFTWAIAFPIGFYSAIRQYSIGDYLFTFVGFIGLATPNFLLALVLMFLGYHLFDASVGGLFSPRYVHAPWSWAKFVDMMRHMWIPVIVVGTAGTAGLIRVLRNNLLDELQKPYVTTARARGLKEYQLILKYPVRLALNPFISTVGWILPTLVSGAAITAVVLNLPTSGAVLLEALLWQDMYLAGAIIMLLAVMTVIGTLISDVLLALADPRIRFERTARAGG